MFKPIGPAIMRATASSQMTESPIEKILFEAFLRSNKFTIIKDGDVPQGEGNFVFTQKQIGPYRVDFYIKSSLYINGCRIWPPRLGAETVVECDGLEFHSSPEQKSHDRQRDQYLKGLGISVIRLSGAQIYRYPDGSVRDVESFIHDKLRAAP